jgi:hypothetical protein
VLEEVYENQSRSATGAWVPAAIPNTDVVSWANTPWDGGSKATGWEVLGAAVVQGKELRLSLDSYGL